MNYEQYIGCTIKWGSHKAVILQYQGSYEEGSFICRFLDWPEAGNATFSLNVFDSKLQEVLPDLTEVFNDDGVVLRVSDEADPFLEVDGGKEPGYAAVQDFHDRVISNQVRFGAGYRTINGHKQYFAWHGYPNRNDDYFTTAEITEVEFSQIEKEYPEEIDADRETAQIFRDKYVEGHKVIIEGWNRLLP